MRVHTMSEWPADQFVLIESRIAQPATCGEQQTRVTIEEQHRAARVILDQRAIELVAEAQLCTDALLLRDVDR